MAAGVCRVIAYLRTHNIVARRVGCHHFVARPVLLSSARRHPLSPRVESFRVRARRGRSSAAGDFTPFTMPVTYISCLSVDGLNVARLNLASTRTCIISSCALHTRQRALHFEEHDCRYKIKFFSCEHLLCEWCYLHEV